ncbi:fluoride efflux transporter CrcB [Halomonas sp. NO4]|uniref:fluoride efflux transporter CrcB n=1 Tax=Halomonas sp. NO4 TaxID=2484813 RepID=UPI0013D84FA3|nr:fluoride efflux transporter CrcB [Halomonas sp. NO4]
MWLSMLAISAGAVLGANLRWGLGVWLNALFPAIPPGTLIANLLGGWAIGVAIALFAHLPQIAPEWRLFLITGFLGALTTFSAFSAEIFTQIQAERWGMALLGVVVHVGGSLMMTGLGIATFAAMRALIGASR